MRKFYIVMAVVITFLVVLNIQVTGVGATTPQSPQQKIAVLLKDAKAVLAKANTKTCKTLTVDTRKYKNFKIVNPLMQTEWIEMSSYFEEAGDADCKHPAVWSPKKDIKKAQDKAHILTTKFNNHDENRIEYPS